MVGMMSLVLSTMLQASGASVCAMSTGYAPFEIGKDAQPQAAPEDALDAPKAELISITRGVGGAPGSCDASGIMVVKVKPRGNRYPDGEVGIELEVHGDAATSPALSTRFLSIAPGNSRDELLLMWPDAAPGQQRPLRFDLDVRSVTRDYQRGPATVLHVDMRDADVIKAEAKAAKEAEKEQRKLAREQSDN